MPQCVFISYKLEPLVPVFFLPGCCFLEELMSLWKLHFWCFQLQFSIGVFFHWAVNLVPVLSHCWRRHNLARLLCFWWIFERWKIHVCSHHSLKTSRTCLTLFWVAGGDTSRRNVRVASSGCFAETEKSLMVFIRQHTHHTCYINLMVRPTCNFVFCEVL